MISGGKPVQIVGGGLAGLTLGIGLRQQQVPVTLWEAGHYPRHRVCGEVLSGRGYDVLGRLGLLAILQAAGGQLAQTAAFFVEGKSMPLFPLPYPALCVARYAFDDVLAKRFRELGGELREGERWQEARLPPGVIRASGRPAQGMEGGWRWFGVKAHARNIGLSADVEMHLLNSGYVGLCKLRDGWVNVCGLFRRNRGSPPAAGSVVDWLRGPVGTALYRCLGGAEWDQDSLCTVAGLPLRPRYAWDSSECRVGDALTMIPPVTGNGMSMAIEAADLCTSIMTAYSRGQLTWNAARDRWAAASEARFGRRLWVARWMHQALFHPAGRKGLRLAGRCRGLWRGLFTWTR